MRQLDRSTATSAGVSGAVPTPVLPGLGSQEAAALLGRHGPNTLPQAARPGLVREAFGQLTHAFALLLWAASALALLGGMPVLSVAIALVVVLNGAFSFVQQHRADRASEALRDLLPRQVVARRDGQPVSLVADDVVPGDVLLLTGGDHVPADGVLLPGGPVTVDASTLTGESEPVTVLAGGAVSAGCYLVTGQAEVQVTATGAATRLGALAVLAARPSGVPTPLGAELQRIVRVVGLGAVVAGTTFFGLALLLGIGTTEAFLLGIGITVALVPEGLLPTVTLSLAHGAQRLAAHHALVRNLEAVETLGSTTFICTDKTGTLTQNRMAVVEVWTTAGTVHVVGDGYSPRAHVLGTPDALAVLPELAVTARRCSTGRARLDEHGAWSAVGDPMEAALDTLARRLVVPPDDSPSDVRFPFDERLRASVLDGQHLSLKGAPERVLPLCTASPGALEAVAAMAGRGLRVLAVARRTGVAPSSSVEQAERGMELLGLVGLEDPPRPSVPAALVACRRAGIRVGVVTGDYGVTARAIAEEVGLWTADSLLLEGPDLPDEDVALGELVDRDGVVVCRVTPEQKLRIARALRGRGHVVAMTGDGVNDGPALREADIGVAMGASGTDVARQAADLVLLDDDFATIVVAVKHGRATYANIRRFLTYHLTDNVAEVTPFVVWSLTGSAIPLAIGVLQVLVLDLATDLLPALALGAQAPSDGVLDGPPDRSRLIDGGLLRRSFGLLGPTEAVVSMLAFLAVLSAGGWSWGEDASGALLATASGTAFTAIVLGQLAVSLACRSRTLPVWGMPLLSNPLLLWAMAVQVVVLVGLLAVPVISDALGHQVPSLLGVAVAALAFPAVLVVDGVHKRARRLAA